MEPSDKRTMTFRLSLEARRAIDETAKSLKMNRTEVIEATAIAMAEACRKVDAEKRADKRAAAGAA